MRESVLSRANLMRKGRSWSATHHILPLRIFLCRSLKTSIDCILAKTDIILIEAVHIMCVQFYRSLHCWSNSELAFSQDSTILTTIFATTKRNFPYLYSMDFLFGKQLFFDLSPQSFLQLMTPYLDCWTKKDGFYFYLDPL